MDQLFTTRPALGADHHEIATPELGATRGLAAAALRIIGLLALATLAILVMLPAMIAAQPTFLG